MDSKSNGKGKNDYRIFRCSSEYAYFDKDGKIVHKSTELRDGVPGIEGIDASSTKLYQKIKVKSNKLLQAILNVAVEVKN